MAARRSLQLWLVAAVLLTVPALVGAGLRLSQDEPPTPETGAVQADPQVAQAPPAGFLKGMTVSCPTYGPVWGSPLMTSSLAELKGELGVEWVAIHPYAQVSRDGAIRFTPAAETGYLADAVDIATEQGIRWLWKPHLAYWGSFQWRGAIVFGDEGSWKRFFDGYEAFIVDQARFAQAHGIEWFSIGLEYERTVHRPEWRRIIAAVRAVYRGKVTYGANWDGVERVPFWDELDAIGVQAYFPMQRKDEATAPTTQRLRTRWRRLLGRLDEVSTKFAHKPLLFTEIGYARSTQAALEPWTPATDASEGARALRRRLIEVALDEAPRNPRVLGMFWWKWMPGPSLWDRDFSMRDEEALAALRASWGPRKKSARP